MNNRIVFCSDHINKNFSLKEAIEFSLSNKAMLEVHNKHFKELFNLKSFNSIIAIHPHWRDYSLSTDDELIYNKGINFLKKLIEFAGNNHIKYIILHPEGYPPNLDIDIRYQIILESFRTLINFAKKYNIIILLENMPPARIYPPSELPGYYIGEKLDDLISIFDIDSNIEFIFDLGHFICSYKIYGNKELKILKSLNKKLTYVHVHDNDGTKNNHEPLKRESSIQILNMIEEYYKPIYSIEVNPIFNGLDITLKNLYQIIKEK